MVDATRGWYRGISTRVVVQHVWLQPYMENRGNGTKYMSASETKADIKEVHLPHPPFLLTILIDVNHKFH